jgi:hypothetical protein
MYIINKMMLILDVVIMVLQIFYCLSILLHPIDKKYIYVWNVMLNKGFGTHAKYVDFQMPMYTNALLSNHWFYTQSLPFQNIELHIKNWKLGF